MAKVVFITGGARGIGADAGRRLAGRGDRVALVDRNPLVERTAAEIGALGIVADVTDPDAIGEAVATTVSELGGIDVAVAGAGIVGTAATVQALDPADFEKVLEVNLLGVWRTLRAALPHVVARRGYLLPIASIAAAIPSPLLNAYGVSKAGVEALGRALRIELAHTGTRVGVAYFGVVDTDMVAEATAQAPIARTRTMMPAIVDRPLPVGAAGAAIVRGIDRRANKVYAPWWVPILLATRGFQGPVEAVLGRNRVLREAFRS
ncbi:MAG TPA: SDR family NAD(P)-dependent oxidoreductase [Thermoleophilaceae bacterium]|jgi:NAD(P)-dependent dehydrogenase (short-subunit alcohol dehydrogenase family)